MSLPQVLRVSRFDPASATSKQKQIIQLELEKPIVGESLRSIRKLLRENNVFESKDFKSPFCEKNGSDVGDDMSFKLYLQLLGKEDPSTGPLDVYFKAKKIFSPIDQTTQDLISEKLDLAFQQEPEMIKKNPELLTSSFNPDQWKAVKGDISHAADLTEREWSVIIRTNCLLSGHRILTTSYSSRDESRLVKALDGIERSPYNAFKLEPRKFEAYEISSSGLDDPSNNVDEECSFRIPRFRVDDDSSVTIVETKSSFEKSMADSSFSETSFQVAASGGFLGVSLGVQAGAAKANSKDSSSVSSREESSLVANYNFPRVTLYWDHKSLKVTEECLEDIQKVVDARSLNRFNEKYGHIFAKRVQLGGRLSSSEKVVKTGKGNTTAQAEKLKTNASASISSSFFQASVSASHEEQSKQSQSSSNKGHNSSMAWEATGGDTLLCNNPAKWCSTVSLHENWRIVNQDEVIPLYQFLSRFSEVGESIIQRFENSAKDRYSNSDSAPKSVTPAKDQTPQKPIVQQSSMRKQNASIMELLRNS
ncbi:uncharacterized protein FTOL_06731 [Fusarium torulosum]|uniref:MACPF-like domain-containing protein n=1 Tax=Fusarium torulosum TaxID=33205 RepID=A0AAE8MA91_9HYPO|nr:uncharacterized protein FTOL_06731 [Fusarium torulosum]